MFQIGWTKDKATLIASNKVKDYFQGQSDGRSSKIQVWDYMVELPGADGQPTRLVIRVRGSYRDDYPDIGATVPVVVNRSRTKAAFDMDDPSISPKARRKLGEQRQKENKAKKRAEFERKLDERG